MMPRAMGRKARPVRMGLYPCMFWRYWVRKKNTENTDVPDGKHDPVGARAVPVGEDRQGHQGGRMGSLDGEEADEQDRRRHQRQMVPDAPQPWREELVSP